MARLADVRLLSAHLHSPGDGRFSWRLLPLWLALLAACASPPATHGRALVVVDDIGDTLRLAQPARRVVSLSPATTELLFAVGAGDRVVGRTRWCDYPPAAARVPSVGDGMPPNVEQVVAARPDLVLLYRSAANDGPREQLRHAGIPVLTLSFDHLSDVSRLARLLGPLVEAGPRADSLAGAYDSALASLASRVLDSAGPRVLLLAWDQPPMTIGAGSFQSEILRLAGGRNLFADVGSPSATVSLEAIAARNPDLILVSDTGTPAIASRPEWQAVDAVRARRFLHFSNPAFGRPSPRAPDLIRELADSLRRRVP